MIKVLWHSEFDLHLQSFHPFETNIKIIFGFLKHVEFAEIVGTMLFLVVGCRI